MPDTLTIRNVQPYVTRSGPREWTLTLRPWPGREGKTLTARMSIADFVSIWQAFDDQLQTVAEESQGKKT